MNPKIFMRLTEDAQSMVKLIIEKRDEAHAEMLSAPDSEILKARAKYMALADLISKYEEDVEIQERRANGAQSEPNVED